LNIRIGDANQARINAAVDEYLKASVAPEEAAEPGPQNHPPSPRLRRTSRPRLQGRCERVNEFVRRLGLEQPRADRIILHQARQHSHAD